jgi:RND superfamily putative drug exporter
MPDPDAAPGTGVMEGIAPALRAAAPRGVTVSVTGFEQVQAVGAGRSNEDAILAASPTAARAAPPPARARLNHRL